MTLANIIDLLKSDLGNEYKHLLFYMHAANMLIGMGRLYLADKLKAHAASEMEHVYQFAHKIRGWGGIPISGLASEKFPENLTSAFDIIDYAIEMEREVVANYHTRHAQAEALYEETGKCMDIALFLEEQIEHSQEDVDELVQIQLDWKQ